jgi:hypothetical protein
MGLGPKAAAEFAWHRRLDALFLLRDGESGIRSEAAGSLFSPSPTVAAGAE